MGNINIIITENQYSKLVESQIEENNPFWKPVFDANNKTMDVAYYLWDETADSYRILNVVEDIRRGVWASGDKDYLVYPKSAFLPKKFVEKLDAVPDRPGYFFFRVPYWVYKKDSNLPVKRIATPNKKFSLLNIDDKFYSMLNNPKFMEALLGVDTNETFLENLKKGYDNILQIRQKNQEKENPSQNQTSSYPLEKETQVWRNIRTSSSDPDSTDQSAQEN